ncbi:Septin 4 [Podila minutissima]|uniref:Septin 4 n=1 Tax=Podila minutissima TaxID=64525 RepID=A0A9P5SJ75_9FUNG|nr:Septin 4 [Podila minutissima]
MTATLPLEIAPSLRLVLVGDTGVGKTKASSLFLSTVPGQVSSDPNLDIAALTIDNDDTALSNEAQDPFRTTGTVSTLQVPAWLKVPTTSTNSSSTDTDNSPASDALLPADNIVLHDFVGYGQSLDARQTIDRVDAFLSEQYTATRNLFGPSITPLSTLSASANGPSLLEQLLVDSPMAHSLPDACLYFILYDLKPVDIAFMQRIMRHVNLIPILAKADTLSVNQLWKAKGRILKQLQDNGIEFYQFGFTVDELREMAAENLAGGPPFALSTAQLEQGGEFLVAPEAAASLTELAVDINEGKFANTRSDQSLLQALLLGSKNRMLHQASVRKFLNRWKTDLGIPIEEPQIPASTASDAASDAASNAASDVASDAASDAAAVPDEGPKETTASPEQEPLQQQEPQLHQPQPQSKPQLPPSLQPVYQPTSSYTSYMAAKGPEDEVAQVIKLNRQRSFIRTASPTTKIYTQGSGVVPPVPMPPSSLSNTSTSSADPSSPSSPNSTPSLSGANTVVSP